MAFGVYNVETWTGDHLVERCATEREARIARFRWMREYPALRFAVKPLKGSVCGEAK